jgi:hypothetical protein
VKSSAKVRSPEYCWPPEDQQPETLPAKWLGRVENSDHEISSVEIIYRKRKLIGLWATHDMILSQNLVHTSHSKDEQVPKKKQK